MNPDQQIEAPGGVQGKARQGERGDAGEARGAAGEGLRLVQDDVDDDAEAQGGHGQVITPELQGRDADEKGGAARDGQAGQQRPARG